MFAAKHREEIVNAVNTFFLLRNNLGADGVFVSAVRLSGNVLCLRLINRLLWIALVRVTRRCNHITNVVWHLFEVLNTFRLDTGHSLKGWCDLVGKTQLDAFTAVHPGFIFKHRRDFITGLAGFRCISGDQHGLNLVQQFGIVTHIVSIATSKAPGLVDHHHGVFRHDDRITHHCNDGCHRSRQAVDMNGNCSSVVFKGIKNGYAIKDIATR